MMDTFDKALTKQGESLEEFSQEQGESPEKSIQLRGESVDQVLARMGFDESDIEKANAFVQFASADGGYSSKLAMGITAGRLLTVTKEIEEVKSRIEKRRVIVESEPANYDDKGRPVSSKTERLMNRDMHYLRQLQSILTDTINASTDQTRVVLDFSKIKAEADKNLDKNRKKKSKFGADPRTTVET